MAKPRKQRHDGGQQQQQMSENPGGTTILHQKLCLSVDMNKKIIYGHTEMNVIVPEVGYVALHAENMTIRRVFVDGEAAEFEILPQKIIGDEKSLGPVSCSQSAADIACSAYISSLDKEMVPNLLISCEKSTKSSAGQEQTNGSIALQKSEEQLMDGCNGVEKKNVKLIRIDYLVENGGTGILFGDNVLHTDNQIRRAHCWFPCMDSLLQRCSYHLEFTVDSNFVAVSNGNLLYQVLTKDDPPRKTYVYDLNVPVSAAWISLVVARFELLPDSHDETILHMCLQPNFLKLQKTIGFFHSAFSYYEDYLSTSFPFGSYKQVFIPPEMPVSSVGLGASVGVFSSELLFDEKVIDQTIDTRIKLAYALARQWFGVYITAEEPTDEWLLEGLAGFLTDLFTKRFLGNNEARFRRYKANCAVCKADVSGATALSSAQASTDLYGTQSIGSYGKIRKWKAVTVLQMLEKQMGPDAFRKILQNIVSRASGASRPLRTLSTKEFRHLANKVGNLERPFLKEFFPRWVESFGCPIMRMGISYNKRRNMVEVACIRGCTADANVVSSGKVEGEAREGDAGWPGMMSIRVHEIDGMYDHPSLPMAGEACQILEIQCHSKLAAKRFQKPKKGAKADGSDDNADASTPLDMRNGVESPLLWIRVDPEMEYLAEIHFYQPVQMWINQLEKDRDVVAQSQAIAVLQTLPRLSFSVVNALNNFLNDTKAFWRVRVEAAYALARTASEGTDWAGLLHLIKFYKSRRFDDDIGLPRPNDFHDVPEYFVLEAIPHAVALVRAVERRSPREAVEFLLQLLKYNDNNGNLYSDVFWLAALVESVGELEISQQNLASLASLLKRIDRLLQVDRLMPSYNGILTISCIRTLVQVALKMSDSMDYERMFKLIKPFRDLKNAPWKVRIEASRGLLDLEFHFKGLDAALSLFIKLLEEEPSLRGEVKLAIHAMQLCQVNVECDCNVAIAQSTLVALLCQLPSRKAFNNVFLRHYLFCILQILAGRPPTLFGVPKTQLHPSNAVEQYSEELMDLSKNLRISKPPEVMVTQGLSEALPPVAEGTKEADTISACSERRTNILKIRVKQPSSSSKADGIDHGKDRSQGGQNEAEFGPSSSMSVDAPARITNEPSNTNNQHIEELHSSHDQESRMSGSIKSAKIVENIESSKDLQCTADSRDHATNQDHSSSAIDKIEDVQMIQPKEHNDTGPSQGTENARQKKKDKKDKEGKRKRGENGEKDRQDPQYLERKRQKKEKKRMLKELAKLKKGEVLTGAPEPVQKAETQLPSSELKVHKGESPISQSGPHGSSKITVSTDVPNPVDLKKSGTGEPNVVVGVDVGSQPLQGRPTTKIKLKIKGKSIGNV